MKKFKYFYILLLLFFVGLSIENANANNITCEYTISCADLERFALPGIGWIDKNISVIKDEKGYFFDFGSGYNYDTSDSIDLFCGVADFDILNVSRFKEYFLSGDYEDEGNVCPVITFAIRDSDNQLVLTTQKDFTNNKDDYNTSEGPTSDLSPLNIEPNKLEYNSDSVSCYYFASGNFEEEIVKYHIMFNLDDSTELIGDTNVFAENSVRISTKPSSESECPQKIVLCGIPPNRYFTDNVCDDNGNIKNIIFDNISYDEYIDSGNNQGNGSNINADLSGCIIDSSTQEIIDWILNMVRFVGIILVIVLGMLDFIKATASGDQEETRKSRGKFVKRLIACIALFLAPIIVEFLLWMINSGSTNC